MVKFQQWDGKGFKQITQFMAGDRALVRKMVEDHGFNFEGKEISVTISIGVADMVADMTEPMQFIKVADANLYKAKKAGRNQVVAS